MGLDCSRIDANKALRAIQKTRETGNEHAFAVCSDGTTSDIVEGTERQVNIEVDCSGKAGIFHVHPNDVMHLSDQDMQTLNNEGIDMVCVSDTQGNMKCELDGEDFACVSDLKDEGSTDLESAPHALYEEDGTTFALALLPKPECPFDSRMTLNSYDLETEGDVVLWFHPKAEGCRCSSQAVQMDQLAREHSAKVVGVNTESESHNETFRDAYDLSFPIVSDVDHELIEQFDVPLDENGRPERTTVFVRDGQEIDRVSGLFGADDAAKRLESPNCGCGKQVSEPPEILEYVEHPSVATIVGQRRSGKSSLAYHVGEAMYQHEGVQPVTVNVPDDVATKLPEHWVHVSSIRNAPNNSVVVYDEAYRSIHSRTPMSDENLDLTEIVELSAQRDQTLLFVTQNSSILDKVAVGESDVMFVKKPGKLSMKFERAGIRDLSESARERFEMLPDDADHRQYVYVYGEDGEAFVTNEEAPFYSDDISKSFACRDEPEEKRIHVE